MVKVKDKILPLYFCKKCERESKYIDMDGLCPVCGDFEVNKIKMVKPFNYLKFIKDKKITSIEKINNELLLIKFIDNTSKEIKLTLKLKEERFKIKPINFDKYLCNRNFMVLSDDFFTEDIINFIKNKI